jgi:hypothetical protein
MRQDDSMDSWFAHMIAPEPISSEAIFGVRVASPDLRGRARPLGGTDEDGFQFELTADSAVAAAAGSLQD